VLCQLSYPSGLPEGTGLEPATTRLQGEELLTCAPGTQDAAPPEVKAAYGAGQATGRSSQTAEAGAALRFELILCKKYPFACAPGGATYSVFEPSRDQDGSGVSRSKGSSRSLRTGRGCYPQRRARASCPHMGNDEGGSHGKAPSGKRARWGPGAR
jgi:hypothetical protein